MVPPTGGSDGDNEGKQGKKKSSTRKYICDCCGISVRATKDVDIMCINCTKRYGQGGLACLSALK